MEPLELEDSTYSLGCFGSSSHGVRGLGFHNITIGGNVSILSFEGHNVTTKDVHDVEDQPWPLILTFDFVLAEFHLEVFWVF